MPKISKFGKTGVRIEYTTDEARKEFGSTIIDNMVNRVPPDHEPLTFYQIDRGAQMSRYGQQLRAVCTSPIFTDPERWYFAGRTANDWKRQNKQRVHKHVRPGRDSLEEADL